MAKNPFETFGLTPEMVGALSEKDLFSVLKSMYRALAKTVHPDVARRKPKPGEADRAVELNLAFEELNLDKNPAAFRRHRKSFVARRPRVAYQKSLALERELALQAAKEERLASAYLDRLVADYGWGSEAVPTAGEPEEAGLVPRSIPFPLKNLRLGLLDVAINQNLKMVYWSVGSNYKEINFDASGTMTVKPVGRTRFAKAAYIRLLGTVPSGDVELMPLLDRPPARFFKAPALNASIGANGPSLSVLNRISRERFQAHVLTHLRPEVSERSYLFSLNRPEFEESGFLTLEGLIVKIDRL
ncbi:MAG: J domain-containing protein [Candidatus Adiutrix sp.]|nr:J domain-containing protein [Candidatus Adiutrix sp.]